MVADVLRRTGSEAQARQILERLLTRLDGIAHKGADQLAARGMALAALGRRDEAIQSFEQAAGAGWRLLIDFDYFVRVADDPFMAEVARRASLPPAGRCGSRPTTPGCARILSADPPRPAGRLALVDILPAEDPGRSKPDQSQDQAAGDRERGAGQVIEKGPDGKATVHDLARR